MTRITLEYSQTQSRSVQKLRENPGYYRTHVQDPQ